jgi:transcriptional regulator with PAS, ATPase and Fis domain
MVGNSRPIQEIKAYIRKMANIDCNVLITGETGTGKEIVATLIHQYSKRQQQPLVTINCAAIPESLLESELFGYERGAFTGAHTASPGALQQAQGGTVFLDEIGDMSPYAQAKVLRAIESKEIRRLGGKRTIPLNIRIIAATNQDLERLVADGSFRKDLYFRLNVACIHLPPLRDRKEDIPLLLTHYIQDANRRFGRAVENFTVEAIACLLCYEWPGNVRELKNVVETTFFNLSTGHTAFVDLPELLRQRVSTAGGLALEERDRLLCALYATKWNKSKAAQKLHWSRMTLYRKMTKYHIIESIEKTDAVPLSRESPF